MKRPLEDAGRSKIGSRGRCAPVPGLLRRKECSEVACQQFGFFDRREVPTSGHHGPPTDVVETLGPLAWRAALRLVIIGENGDGGRDGDEVFRAGCDAEYPAGALSIGNSLRMFLGGSQLDAMGRSFGSIAPLLSQSCAAELGRPSSSTSRSVRSILFAVASTTEPGKSALDRCSRRSCS
jgi:hypothetical protein